MTDDILAPPPRPAWCNDSDDPGDECVGCSGDGCGHPNVEQRMAEAEALSDAVMGR